MNRNEFIRLFEDAIEADHGTVSEDDMLEDMKSWDSTSVMAFLAAIDQNFNIVLKPDDIAKSKTVKDLMSLLGDRIQ